MSLDTFKNKYNQLLGQLNGAAADLSFIKTKEKGFEALVLADVMTEYARVYGGVAKLDAPSNSVFLNMGPGKFKLDRAYKIEFNSGDVFYFAADVEVFGLVAYNDQKPAGTLFEADIVVIGEEHANEIINNFRGYPAPQHLHGAYECKHGQYHKGQLRELLGFRRHVSYLRGRTKSYAANPNAIYGIDIQNSDPPITINMVRPRYFKFFDLDTAVLYDLQQLVVN